MRRLGLVYVLLGIGVPVVAWCFVRTSAIPSHHLGGALGRIADEEVALPWPQRQQVIEWEVDLHGIMNRMPPQEPEHLGAEDDTTDRAAEPPDTVEEPTVPLDGLLGKPGVVKHYWRMGEVKVPYWCIMAGGAAAVLIGTGLMVWPSLSQRNRPVPKL